METRESSLGENTWQFAHLCTSLGFLHFVTQNLIMFIRQFGYLEVYD